MNLPNYSNPIPILISVVGMSPNVITETLYGILQSGKPMPERIIALTTSVGKQYIEASGFLTEDGPLASFCRDYKLAKIKFSTEDIKVAHYNGQALNDASTEQEHAVLADFITSEVRALTKLSTIEIQHIDSSLGLELGNTDKELKRIMDSYMIGVKHYRQVKRRAINKKNVLEFSFDKYTIHASIAGGRKSMTFLLGYAMSLFGRSHDQVTHVLVDEWVERCRDFYYPSPNPDLRCIDDKGTKKDFSTAKVMLAEMPIVRMSQSMPEELLSQERGYSETIDLFNRLNEQPSLVLDIKAQIMECNGCKVELNAQQMAFMWAWAMQENPVNREDDDVILLIVNAYISLIDRRAVKYDSDVKALEHIAKGDCYNDKFIVGDVDIKTILNSALMKGFVNPQDCGGTFGCKRFHKDKTAIKESIAQALSASVAERYLPIQVDQEATGKGRKGEALFMIDIPRKRMSIVNAYW